MDKVRTRIAPSPTGFLHIGTARTALFNWLFARKHGGEFILRIEDTDLERSDKKYEEDIIEGLKWLGLDWNGEIYRQSKRLDVYEKYLRQLLDYGKAFWCNHSKEELEQESNEQRTQNQAPRHVCIYKRQETRDKGQEKDGVIRLKVDENSDRKIKFYDEVRGDIEFEERLFGDFSLAKDPRTPLYNFAAVVDDIDMQISHVIRGEDHISNTPKQLLIYEALGVQPPTFAHLPLILASDRSKLSKRHGATSVVDFKQDYLSEALVNFMGFLGYTYNKEIISKEEMAEEFELSKVHKSGAVFDVKKLNWINSQYIKNLSAYQLISLSAFAEVPEKALPLISERLEKLTDVQSFDYFWRELEYDKNLLAWRKSTLERSLETLEEVKKIIDEFDFKNKDELRGKLDELGKKVGDRGLVYWPLRVALTGKEKSPDPVDIMLVLGKKETLERVERAILLN